MTLPNRNGKYGSNILKIFLMKFYITHFALPIFEEE
jgi:hypothetical protein